MSRSYRHTPKAAVTTAASEKADKQLANRRLRAAVRTALAAGAEVMPELREVSDADHHFAKDGKTYGVALREGR
jgi:hypothetical protein